VQIKFQRETHVTWKNLSTVIWAIVLMLGRKNFYDFQFHAALQLKPPDLNIYCFFMPAGRSFSTSVMMGEWESLNGYEKTLKLHAGRAS
jgi:hypothetical protein